MSKTIVQRAYASRRKAIALLRERGWTLARIAERWGITKQRVSQILKES